MGKVIIETGALANGLYYVQKTGAKQFALIADDSREQLTLTGNYSYFLPDGKVLEKIIVTPIADTSLSLGTTSLGSEIMPAMSLAANQAAIIDLGIYAQGDRTIYFNGIVSNTIVKFYKR